MPVSAMNTFLCILLLWLVVVVVFFGFLEVHTFFVEHLMKTTITTVVDRVWWRKKSDNRMKMCAHTKFDVVQTATNHTHTQYTQWSEFKNEKNVTTRNFILVDARSWVRARYYSHILASSMCTVVWACVPVCVFVLVNIITSLFSFCVLFLILKRRHTHTPTILLLLPFCW